MNREQELLNNCISYIWEHIESYSDMIDTFKRLDFTEEELLKYHLIDYEFEEELNKGGDE